MAAFFNHMPYMTPQIQPMIPPLAWQKPIPRVMQKNSFLLQQVDAENMVPEPALKKLHKRAIMAAHLVRVTTDALHSVQQISQQLLSDIVIN